MEKYNFDQIDMILEENIKESIRHKYKCKSDYVNELKKLLVDNISEKKSISLLSEEIGVNQTSLSSFFKEETGLSPYKWLKKKD